MNTNFWGPSGWMFLHSITSIYPIKPSTNDKILMHEFMNIICNILPCKYCRISFAMYSKTLDIIPYLESRQLLCEWLYKMHNKVNNKLRHQGYCTTKNPELEIINKYIKIMTYRIDAIYKKITLKTITKDDALKLCINYICNLGYKFIGSIVFNYQGYYTNCHTSDEKLNIISIYNKFFNIIQTLICNYISKYNTYSKLVCDAHTIKQIKKINIKNILTHTEAYSKLKTWFFNNTLLCNRDVDTDFDDNKHKITDYNEYEKYFNKHIVSYCNSPEPTQNNINNSCR